MGAVGRTTVLVRSSVWNLYTSRTLHLDGTSCVAVRCGIGANGEARRPHPCGMGLVQSTTSCQKPHTAQRTNTECANRPHRVSIVLIGCVNCPGNSALVSSSASFRATILVQQPVRLAHHHQLLVSHNHWLMTRPSEIDATETLIKRTLWMVNVQGTRNCSRKAVTKKRHGRSTRFSLSHAATTNCPSPRTVRRSGHKHSMVSADNRKAGSTRRPARTRPIAQERRVVHRQEGVEASPAWPAPCPATARTFGTPSHCCRAGTLDESSTTG